MRTGSLQIETLVRGQYNRLSTKKIAGDDPAFDAVAVSQPPENPQQGTLEHDDQGARQLAVVTVAVRDPGSDDTLIGSRRGLTSQR
jgi:hypothetical protein